MESGGVDQGPLAVLGRRIPGQIEILPSPCPRHRSNGSDRPPHGSLGCREAARYRPPCLGLIRRSPGEQTHVSNPEVEDEAKTRVGLTGDRWFVRPQALGMRHGAARAGECRSRSPNVALGLTRALHNGSGLRRAILSEALAGLPGRPRQRPPPSCFPGQSPGRTKRSGTPSGTWPGWAGEALPLLGTLPGAPYLAQDRLPTSVTCCNEGKGHGQRPALRTGGRGR